MSTLEKYYAEIRRSQRLLAKGVGNVDCRRGKL